MTFYADLAPCNYFGNITALRAVGWLDPAQPHARGVVPNDREIEALAHACEKPWQPMFLMGWHDCEFCRLGVGPRTLHVMTPTMGSSVEVRMGISNVFIPARDCIYVAPSLILHYIDSHEYRPPEEFLRALVASPPMGSPAYLAAIRAVSPELVGMEM